MFKYDLPLIFRRVVVFADASLLVVPQLVASLVLINRIMDLKNILVITVPQRMCVALVHWFIIFFCF